MVPPAAASSFHWSICPCETGMFCGGGSAGGVVGVVVTPCTVQLTIALYEALPSMGAVQSWRRSVDTLPSASLLINVTLNALEETEGFLMRCACASPPISTPSISVSTPPIHTLKLKSPPMSVQVGLPAFQSGDHLPVP